MAADTARSIAQQSQAIWSGPASSFTDYSPKRSVTTRGTSPPAGHAGPTNSCCSTWCLATWSCSGCSFWSRCSAGCPITSAASSPAYSTPQPRPFDVINYYGSCAAALVYNRRRMGAKMDRVIASLQRKLAREPDDGLRRGMHFPTRWDPFFKDYMTLEDVYRYPGQHFDFHIHQLALYSAAD